MSVQWWATVGIICGAILALAGVLLLAGRGLSMLWQWRFGNEIKTTLGQVLDSLAELKEEVAQHTRWHPGPSNHAAPTERIDRGNQQQPNTSRRSRRTP